MNPLSKLILHKVEIEKQKAKMDERFTLFSTSFAKELFDSCTKYSDYKFVYDMIKSNDKKCNLLIKDGNSIEKIINSGKAFLHRTNLGINPKESGIPKNESLISIMTTGLRNYGHINAVGGGAVTDYVPSLNTTMSRLKGITGYINLLSPYKENDTIIIAAFPDFLVDDDGRPTTSYKDIYNMYGNIPSVKPDYIKGAFVKKSNGMWIFYPKEEILKPIREKEELEKTMKK